MIVSVTLSIGFSVCICSFDQQFVVAWLIACLSEIEFLERFGFLEKSLFGRVGGESTAGVNPIRFYFFVRTTTVPSLLVTVRVFPSLDHVPASSAGPSPESPIVFEKSKPEIV